MTNFLQTAIRNAHDADSAWTRGYEAICPKREFVGDFRYTKAAKGEEGSDLAKLHCAKIAADAELSKAFAMARAHQHRALPRLAAALRHAGLTENEARGVVDSRRLYADDFSAASEAVCAMGGASKCVSHARHVARIRRATTLARV